MLNRRSFSISAGSLISVLGGFFGARAQGQPLQANGAFAATISASAVRGINHIGITVTDADAATKFLVEALGAQVIYQSFGRDDPPRQGPDFEKGTGAAPGTVVVSA